MRSNGVVGSARGLVPEGHQCWATEAAPAAGWSGFRAVVDATAVARTPAHRAAFGCFEHLIDQKMAALPVTALCAHDGSIGRAAAAEMASLHPWISPATSPFRLFADDGARGLAMAGEIDASGQSVFVRTLARVASLSDGTLKVDVAGVGFMDHRALLTLNDAVTRRGRTALLRGCSPTVARVAQMLRLEGMRVETAA